MNLLTPVDQLAGVGDKISSKFNRLGISTVKDLLWHIPFRYIDASEITPLNKLNIGDNCAVEAKIESVQTFISPRKRIPVLTAKVSDFSGQINIVWYNQIYLKRVLTIGATKIFYGKVFWDFPSHQKTLTHPIILNKEEIIPVYHETAGLGSRTIKNVINKLLENQLLFSDPIPKEIINKYHYPSRIESFGGVHQPKTIGQVALASERLAFDELISISLQLKTNIKNKSGAAKIPI